MKVEEVEELLEGHRPEVKRAVRAALSAIENDTDPEDAALDLAKLGSTLAAGAKPSPAIIVAAIVAGIQLLKWGVKKRQRRIARSRARGTAAGLAAHRASRQNFKLRTGRGQRAKKARGK